MTRSAAAVLFDWDGTLFDAIPLCTSATNATLLAHGYAAVSRAQIHEGMQFPTPERLAFHVTGEPVFSQRFSKALALKMADDFYRRSEALGPEHSRLFPGVREMLDDLHRAGIPVGIVSNNQRSVIESLLRTLGIAEFFGAVVGAEDVDDPKPAAEPAIRCLDLLGITAPAHRVCFVGDLPTDHACAKAAGMIPVGAGWPRTSVVHGSSSPYHKVVPEPSVLLTLTQSWTARTALEST